MTASTTLVYKLNAAQGQRLREALNRGDFQFRRLDHAFFQARGEEVVASYYRSGKLVIQGRGRETFCAHYLEGVPELASRSGAKESGGAAGSGGSGSGASSSDGAHNAIAAEADSLGSDEAGKGDTFGGIAVAAVGVPSAKVEALHEAKVADSKTLQDKRMRVLAPWLREHYPHAERVLSPGAYNQAWIAHGRNVNKLLAELHRQCLAELAADGQVAWQVAVVDRFSAKSPVAGLLHADFPDLQVVEVPRAEQHAAVAAASVLAREAFLCQMDELREHYALDLPLGSGSPVAPALRAFRSLHGEGALGQAAKLHFKNVQRFLDLS